MTNLIQLNQQRWNKCAIKPNKVAAFQSVANRLSAPEARAKYEEVSKITGVPWWFIAVVHEREASQKWNANIAQGDPWKSKSTHVPAGRGPFKSWKDAAVDALTNCAPYAARNKDWSPGGALAMLEKYNGLGYSNMGVPSPYIWSGTDQYTKGKYVADHQYNPSVVDQQLGCAGILKTMDVFSAKTIKHETATGAGAVVVGGGAIVAAQHYPQYEIFLVVLAAAAVVALVWAGVRWYKKGMAHAANG